MLSIKYQAIDRCERHLSPKRSLEKQNNSEWSVSQQPHNIFGGPTELNAAKTCIYLCQT